MGKINNKKVRCFSWSLGILALFLCVRLLSPPLSETETTSSSPRYTTTTKSEEESIGLRAQQKKVCDIYRKDRDPAMRPFRLKMAVCPHCTSQGIQDIVIKRIFDAIGTTNKQCVEFGFGYGIRGLKSEDVTMEQLLKSRSGLNTQALLKDGWKAWYFDAEVVNPRINLIRNVLTSENIASVFRENGVPVDADYVSIDVDSVDIWLLHGMLANGYRPRVISVEYNANFPLHMKISCENRWAPWKARYKIFGASAGAINMVAEMYGYQVVEVMKWLDIFFVRKDALEEHCRMDSLPTFEFLAQNFTGDPIHNGCDATEVRRLVDFPLALKGLEKEAKEKAMADVQELNKWNKERNLPPFCAV